MQEILRQLQDIVISPLEEESFVNAMSHVEIDLSPSYVPGRADLMLMRGVKKYGFGQWDLILSDPNTAFVPSMTGLFYSFMYTWYFLLCS